MGLPQGEERLVKMDLARLNLSEILVKKTLFFLSLPSPLTLSITMFKRPFQAKAFAPMRSSDRRRLQKDLYTHYPLLDPTATDNAQQSTGLSTDIKEEDAPVVATEKGKGGKNSLLPDTILSAKALSHLGEPISVYTDTEGKPLWVRLDIEERGKKKAKFMPTGRIAFDPLDHHHTIPTLLSPSFMVQLNGGRRSSWGDGHLIMSLTSSLFPLSLVYTLWEHPDLFPTVSTHSHVVPILLGGADLMLPGVTIPEEGLPDLREGDWVSITINGHK